MALNVFLQSREQAHTGFSRSEVFLLSEGLNYVQGHQNHFEQHPGVSLSKVDLQQGLQSLASFSGKGQIRDDLRALASKLYRELRERRISSTGVEGSANVSRPSVTQSYISVLASTGGSKEAWDILKISPEGSVQQNWIAVIEGLSNEGFEQHVWEALSDMKERTGDLTAKSHEILVTYFARNASVEATKEMSQQPIAGGASSTVPCRVEMARFCIRNKELKWGKSIFADLRSIPQDPRVWDVILISSAAEGASIGDIGALLDNLDTITNEGNTTGPTMSTINSLIEHAYSLGNPQAAQNYMDMAEERGLRPDSKTYLARLAYEVKIGDLDSSASTFEVLSSEDPITDGSDVPVLNAFLTALCFSSKPDYELIMRIVNTVLDSNVHLDAETVSGLCKVFLERNELEEALGLLRHRVDTYPPNDRARIAQVFKESIIDEKVGAQRAFNAYELFRAAFPETTVDDRLPIMHSFFDRKRPDLGCLVFGHMRQREDPNARPTPAAYSECFQGIARCQDIDGLQMVYNMLKIDLEVDPTTHIRNGLMAAYNACGQPYTSIIDHFWKILNSREGPSLSSFALALQACETWVPQGATEARNIIAMLQSWNVEITKEIYDCYIGAIAGQSEFENAIELIEEMENDTGLRPDAIT
jgi:hypothetical protein